MLGAEEVARLGALTPGELRTHWARLVGSPAPRVGTNMLRLALAWEIQAKAGGGLARATGAALDQLARGRTRTEVARAGMRLVREWRGKTHVVTIGEDAGRGVVVRWDEREWSSLSEVARAITGKRWSGPAFLGLKKPAKASAA